MWLNPKSNIAALFAPLALGLYAGRVLSEQWAVHYGASWAAPVLLTGGLTFLALFSLRQHALRQTWPLLLLFGYVFYPQPSLNAAAIVFLLVTAVIAQQLSLPSKIVPPHRTLQVGLLGSLLLFGLLYILTLAPGLLPADNGEFQLIGATLGVAHPPGFPLYTLLSKAMTWLPIAATAAYKINLLSVITSTATLGLVYLAVWQLTKRHFAAGTAVLGLGTATTFWAQATTANIRSLTALFAALALYALIRHQQEKTNTERYLILLIAALSLGFTHHLSLAFMGVIFGASLLLIDPSLWRTPTRWKRPLLAALTGLIPLIYLPLRAGADVPGASDGLNTVSGFLNHFLALGFQGDFFYFVQPVVLGQRLKVMGNVLTFQFSPWLLAGALLGWLLLLRRNWRLALLLGGSFALHTIVTATYRAPQTVEYMLPAYVPLAICLGVACSPWQEWGWLRQSAASRLSLIVTAVLLTTAVWQGWQHWPSFRWLHHNEDARDYAQNILDEAPPDSLILANWHWATPLWYLQTVEGQRSDVTIEYVAPGEGLYSQTWVNRISEALVDGRTVIATYIDEIAYSALPPFAPIGEAIIFPQTAQFALPADFTPLSLTLNDAAQIVGYRLEQANVELGQQARLTVAWQATETTSLFLHLLDDTGKIVAQSDVQARPQPTGISLTQFRLTSRHGPGNFDLRLGSGRDFAIIGSLSVTASKFPPATENSVYRPVLTSENGQLLVGYDWDQTVPGQTRLYLHYQTDKGFFSTAVDSQESTVLEGVLTAWGIPGQSWQIPPPPANAYYVPLGQGIVWTGTSLNEHLTLSPGGEIQLPMWFRNGRPLLRDYVVSTRLVGYEADGFTWAWCDLVDGVPAMGSIPTLKWIHDSQIQSPREIVFPPRTEPASFSGFCQSKKPAPGAPILFVDNQAAPGQTVGGILRLYDAFTNRPLPILDERITAVYSWIPLGEIIIEE